MKKFLKYWLPVLIWAGVIFFFSNQSYLESPLPQVWDFAMRKTAHITEYFILTWLLLRALFASQTVSISRKKIIFLAIVLSIFYAVTDEFHQSFILGRNPALYDIGFDSFGAILGVLIYKVFKKKFG